jgi:2-desacetyl-2-hydroxyethyl bacteriochlorophyllide A dehydrogenase
VVLGHEAAGEVIAVGAGVTRVAVGDRVAVEPQIACGRCAACARGDSNLCRDVRRPGLGWGGTFAEFMVAPEQVVYRLAPDTPFELGALVEPAAVAMRAFRRGNVRLGDRVAVVGAGPIGGLIAHIADRARPSQLMVSDVKAFNLAFVRDTLGIGGAVDVSDADVVEAGRAMTGGEGFDVVFVTAPHDGGLLEAVQLARPGGRVVQVAIYGHPISIDATQAVLREIEVRASLTYAADDFRLATELIVNGTLDAASFITHRYPLEAAPTAFGDIAGGMDHVKVVLSIPG